MACSRRFFFRRFFAAFLTLALWIAYPTFAAAQAESILHTFPTGNTDGFDTDSGLVADAYGAFYGVTHGGGSACNLNSLGCGVAYKLTATIGGGWSESVLHSFTGHPTDGSFPQGNLVPDSAVHVLYGITVQGGTNDSGTAFSLAPGNPWTETVIYNFPSGQNAQAGLVLHAGMLYGIAAGGPLGVGLVYRLRQPKTSGAPWRQQILYEFTNGADGGFPQATPIVDNAGNVYGTTLSSPGTTAGTVYKLSPPPGGTGAWIYSTLYTFSGDADGNSPHGSVIFDSAGALYGTTETGGTSNFGVAYKLTPPAGGSGAWTESVIYSFTGGTDGGIPWAGLTFDSAGNLYGASEAGGDLSCFNGSGCGNIFKLTPTGTGAWTESVTYDFHGGSDGEEPAYTPLLLNGKLYGTTPAGGGSKNGGIAFEVTP